MTNGKSTVTKDQEEIKRWAKARGGTPARVKGTEDIRINFPGRSDDTLEGISWNQFFDTMKAKNLAFMYEDTRADGETSTFFKLVDASQSDTEMAGRSDETAEA